MDRLKKLLITPYFGPLPEWFDKFEPPKGYEWLFDNRLDEFKYRVRSKLGIDYPGVEGSGKVWDYRCALGLLYEEELKGFDFWGHMDLDVVWGDMDKFLPDSMLENLDVYSSHNEYVCGCFSLYRNTPFVNELFKQYPLWRDEMMYPDPTGWVEKQFSKTLEQSGLRYTYTFNQGNPWTVHPVLKKEGKKLFQDIWGADVANQRWEEIQLFHFRHSKKWPL